MWALVPSLRLSSLNKDARNSLEKAETNTCAELGFLKKLKQSRGRRMPCRARILPLLPELHVLRRHPRRARSSRHHPAPGEVRSVLSSSRLDPLQIHAVAAVGEEGGARTRRRFFAKARGCRRCLVLGQAARREKGESGWRGWHAPPRATTTPRRRRRQRPPPSRVPLL